MAASRPCSRCGADVGRSSVQYQGALLCQACFRLALFSTSKSKAASGDDGPFQWQYRSTGLTTSELLANECRASVQIEGRTVALFCSRDGSQVFCCDDRCYHAGGSLSGGDIEDTGSEAFGHVVVCPWHGYRISLKTGHGVAASGAGYTSKGAKQRVHRVDVRDGGDIYVAFSDLAGELPSDAYYPLA